MNDRSRSARRAQSSELGRLARGLLLVGAGLVLLTTLGRAGQPSAKSGALMPWLPETVGRWQGPIERAAAVHGIHPALVAAQMLIESGGNPEALSARGAVGLMQVMPATAGDIARQRGIASYELSDPETNVDFGAWYLARQLESFGSPGLASAAYNGGPGVVLEWRASGRMNQESARARRYVAGMWRERHLHRSPTFEDWRQRYGEGLLAEARRVPVPAALAAD